MLACLECVICGEWIGRHLLGRLDMLRLELFERHVQCCLVPETAVRHSNSIRSLCPLSSSGCIGLMHVNDCTSKRVLAQISYRSWSPKLYAWQQPDVCQSLSFFLQKTGLINVELFPQFATLPIAWLSNLSWSSWLDSTYTSSFAKVSPRQAANALI